MVIFCSYDTTNSTMYKYEYFTGQPVLTQLLCLVNKIVIYRIATVKRLKDIQKLDDENKSHVFAMLDAFLLKCSIQNNLATPK